jgi:hypothetical protein
VRFALTPVHDQLSFGSRWESLFPAKCANPFFMQNDQEIKMFR